MRDIALSDDDRKRLVLLLAQLFPDNESASKLLDLVRYPNRRWPGFTEKPIEGWQETLRDFDESGPDETSYCELTEKYLAGGGSGL
jgi:Effector-associated domain 1